jgi:malate dehydrogenase (oxaloacetate-decarboxylating)
MVDKQGLVIDGYPGLTKAQKIYAKFSSSRGLTVGSSLLDVIKNVHPSFLIGCSTVAGAFTEEIVKEMAKYTARPVIMPLSNPTSKAEAIPADLFKWTNNKALVATGSPFASVAQCNNVFAFPGLGLGIIAVKARRVTKNMLWAACQAIASSSPVHKDKSAPLLPEITAAPDVSYNVALAVAKQAIDDGVAEETDVVKKIRSIMWQAKYN